MKSTQNKSSFFPKQAEERVVVGKGYKSMVVPNVEGSSSNFVKPQMTRKTFVLKKIPSESKIPTIGGRVFDKQLSTEDSCSHDFPENLAENFVSKKPASMLTSEANETKIEKLQKISLKDNIRKQLFALKQPTVYVKYPIGQEVLQENDPSTSQTKSRSISKGVEKNTQNSKSDTNAKRYDGSTSVLTTGIISDSKENGDERFQKYTDSTKVGKVSECNNIEKSRKSSRIQKSSTRFSNSTAECSTNAVLKKSSLIQENETQQEDSCDTAIVITSEEVTKTRSKRDKGKRKEESLPEIEETCHAEAAKSSNDVPVRRSSRLQNKTNLQSEQCKKLSAPATKISKYVSEGKGVENGSSETEKSSKGKTKKLSKKVIRLGDAPIENFETHPAEIDSKFMNLTTNSVNVHSNEPNFAAKSNGTTDSSIDMNDMLSLMSSVNINETFVVMNPTFSFRPDCDLESSQPTSSSTMKK